MTDKLKELIDKDNFTMPQKTKDKVDETLNRIKTRRVRIRKIIPIAAALVIVMTVSVFAINPSLARNIPGISFIFNELIGYEGEYDKYSEDINQAVSDSGFTITLDSAVMDDKELVLGFTIKGEGAINKVVHLMESDLFIDGKWINSSKGGGGSLVDKNTYISTLSIDLSKANVPEKANFKFVIKGISVDMNKALIEGNWTFNFNTSKSDANKNSHEFKVNKRVLFGSTYITIDKVSTTPLNTTVYFTGMMSDDNIMYCLVDDMGKQIKSKGASWTKDGGHINFDRVNGTPGAIIIWPFSIGNAEWITQKVDKLPVTIKQGKIGQITIDKIDFLSDRTEVYYSVDGSLPLDQVQPLILVDKDGKNICRDHNKHYAPEQLDSSQKNFRTVFPACNKDDIKEIKTINFDKYYKFFDPIKIELK